MEKKGRTNDVEIFKTMKPDFLQIQATELPIIKMAIIGHIILKVVYKYLRPEEWLVVISMGSLGEAQGYWIAYSQGTNSLHTYWASTMCQFSKIRLVVYLGSKKIVDNIS